MWSNPFNGFYSKNNPNLKTSLIVNTFEKNSPSSQGFKIKCNRRSQITTKKNLRPQTGNQNNIRLTYAVLDADQNNERINCMAQSKGFRENDLKQVSLLSVKNEAIEEG